MIGSAEQLGAFAIAPSRHEGPDDPTARFRQGSVRLYARVSPLSDITGGWIASTRVPLAPTTIDLSALTAGSTTSSTGPTEQRRAPYERFEWRRDKPSSLDLGPIGTVDVYDRYSYSFGSFAHRTEMSSAQERALDVVRYRMAGGIEPAPAVTPPPPYVSVIWSLVEAQQLRKARALLKLVPNAPEYARLKKLLSLPVSSSSERKDFDRSAEYKWLAENAKSYAGKWVAVSGDSLLATADTLKALRQEVRKLAPPRTPLLHYVE